ncbi:unnamed protein product [Dicrocoelium dendriticum]|nr:unnamed protein product [Dicrocoelium dendriticum]
MTCKVDTSSNVTISEEEAALYDRQIRLWGVEAQNRLKCSRIVLLGMNALSSEVAKNLVLAGVASLFIIDDDIVSEEDVSSNFLICSDSVGEIKSAASVQRLQSLNPMVKVQAITSVSYNETISNSQDYDVVILASSPLKDDIVRWESVAVTLARVSKESSSPLIIFLSSIHLFGVVFIDLSLHHFIAEEVVLKKRPSGTPGFDSKSADRTETVLVKKVLPRWFCASVFMFLMSFFTTGPYCNRSRWPDVVTFRSFMH